MIGQVRKLLVGETVYVVHTNQVGVDKFNAPICEEELEQVDGVLVNPSSEGEDVIESERPDGARLTYMLHFRKTYDGDLVHKDIIVRGERFSVVGWPERYIEANTPGPWNMPVKVVAIDG